MKRVAALLKKPVWFSIILNAVVLFAALFVYKPFFEENDDAFLAMIAEGAYGVKETHLIYSNILIGYLYKGLYTVLPKVRWHSVLQFVFLFMAFTTLTFVIRLIFDKKKGMARVGSLLSMVFVLGSFHELYVSVQYSKTAVFVCAVGYLLILYSLRCGSDDGEDTKGEVNKYLYIFGYIFLIYGMLLRDSSFLLATLLLIPLGMYEFFEIVMTGRKEGMYFKKLLRFICSFALVCGCYLLSYGINNTSYNKNAGWKDFREYNNTRMELLDYRYDLLDHNKYEERLKGLGISSNDAFMYLTWQFGDDEVLDVDMMKKVLMNAPGRFSFTECCKALLKHIYEDVFIFDPMIIGVLMSGTILLLLLILNNYINKDERAKEKKDAGIKGRILSLIVETVVLAGIFFYYENCGRWSHRIVYAALLAFYIIIIYHLSYIMTVKCDPVKDFNESAREDSLVLAVALIMILLSGISVLLGNRFEYNEYKRSESDYKGFFNHIAENEKNLYIADTFTFQTAYKYEVFSAKEEGSLKNFVAVGSWFINSPITKEITGKYGYSNPFKALAGQKDGGEERAGMKDNGNSVILVDNMSVKQKEEYLSEHYGEREAVMLMEEFGFKEYEIAEK
ncbi:MAG: hypothetical protein K6E98_11770 [Lachnospiraceae bacterium]|nr:hypothetical protein [Lachnospiraceae bacterium]